jgi:glycosyltransferase involved in cell wall biosynthesis
MVAQVTLVIAGDDAGSGYKAVLEQIVVDESLGERVIFTGEVRGDAKYKMLGGADAFALVSHSEGLPIAPLEAMAAGLPIIITPGCNLPDVASHGAGLIVRPDPAEVAAAGVHIFADRRLARNMSEAGQQLVTEKFTWHQIAQRALELYQEAAKVRDR